MAFFWTHSQRKYACTSISTHFTYLFLSSCMLPAPQLTKMDTKVQSEKSFVKQLITRYWMHTIEREDHLVRLFLRLSSCRSRCCVWYCLSGLHRRALITGYGIHASFEHRKNGLHREQLTTVRRSFAGRASSLEGDPASQAYLACCKWSVNISHRYSIYSISRDSERFKSYEFLDCLRLRRSANELSSLPYKCRLSSISCSPLTVW